MALSREQMDVFGLAVEVIECNGTKAMDHSAHTQVQSSSRPGQRPIIEWAVDYIDCLPNCACLSRLIVLAHLPIKHNWTRHEIRRCGGAVRGFYHRAHNRSLYAEGVRYLRTVGRDGRL